MNRLTAFAMLVGSFAALPVHAHLSYTGRDLGTYSASGGNTISNQTVTGNFGWADATDADLGDSHKTRFFKFTLTIPAEVTITATGNAAATSATFAALSPGFSLYSGLGVSAAHDFSVISTANRPAGSEGSLKALDSFSIGNDANVLNTLTYIGHAVDGPVTPLAWTPTGTITGDGLADGTVAKTFNLPAGSYSIAVGGMDYAAQALTNPNLASAYGVTVNLSVAAVPEPQTYALMLAGFALIGVGARHRARAARLGQQQTPSQHTA